MYSMSFSILACMGDRGEVKPVESVLQMAVLGVGCRVKLGLGILRHL
jgi:hypothetical protein